MAEPNLQPPSPDAQGSDHARLAPLGPHTGKPPLPLTRISTVVGSDNHCHIQLASSSVSKQHLLIVSGSDGVYVRDLVARNKTCVNDAEVTESVLNDGDELKVGKFLFKFSPAPSTAGAQLQDAPEAALVDTSNPSGAVRITGRTFLVGRIEGADLLLEDRNVSTRHAIFFQCQGKWYVRDLGSRTGTTLNRVKVRQHELEFGDRLRIGAGTFQFAPASQVGASRVEAGSPQSEFEMSTVLRHKPQPPAPAPVPASDDSLPLPPSEPAGESVGSALDSSSLNLDLDAPTTIKPKPAAAAPSPTPSPQPLPSSSADLPTLGLAPPDESAPNQDAPAPHEPPEPSAPAKPEAPTTIDLADSVHAAPPQDGQRRSDSITTISLADSATDAGADASSSGSASRDFSLDSAAPSPGDSSSMTGPGAPDSSQAQSSLPITPHRGRPRKDEPPARGVLNRAIVRRTPPQRMSDSQQPNQPAPRAGAPLSASPVALAESPDGEGPSIKLESPDVVEARANPAAHAASQPRTFRPLVADPAHEGANGKSLIEGHDAAPAADPGPPILGLELNAADFPSPASASDTHHGSVAGAVVDAPEDSAEPAPHEAGPVEEILDSTDAVLGSAIDLDAELPASDRAAATASHLDSGPEPVNGEMTDTAFGESVQELSDSSPLVEDAPPEKPVLAQLEPPAAAPPASQEQPTSAPPTPAEPSVAAQPEAPPPPAARTPGAIGLGAINLDHHLGGMPLPFNDPPATRSPIHLEGSPTRPLWGAGIGFEQHGARMLSDVPPAMPAPTKPAPATPPQASPTSPQASPISTTAASPPPAQQSSAPKPQQPSAPPRMPPSAAKPVSKPRSAPPAPGARRGPFATDPFEISPDDIGMAPIPEEPPPPAAGRPSLQMRSAFDGLAMPLGGKDTFSDATPAAPSDAAFGGARLSRGDDHIVPDSPRSAAKQSASPEKDFAEDDFWNRTDEEEDTKGKKTATASPQPAKPSAPTPSASASSASAPPKPAPSKPAVSKPSPGPAAAKPAKPAAPSSPAPIQAQQVPADPFTATGRSGTAAPSIPPAIAPAIQPPPAAGAKPRHSPTPQPMASLRPSPPPTAPPHTAPPHTAPPHTAPSSRRPPPMPPVVPPPAAEHQTAKPKRKRRLIPFLMLAMLLCMGSGIVAIHTFLPAHSRVSGTLTFLNFNYVRGTDDGDRFMVSQQQLMQRESTRLHAIELLQHQHPGTPAGFLGQFDSYLPLVRNMTVTSDHAGGVPRTTMQLDVTGADERGDRMRMDALLAAMIDANAPALDQNRRVFDAARQAQADYEQAAASFKQLQSQVEQDQKRIHQAPSDQDLAELSHKQFEAQSAMLAAQQAWSKMQDEDSSDTLGTPAAAVEQPPTAANDLKMRALKEQLADMSKQLAAARETQITDASAARSGLADACKQFSDRIDTATNAAASNNTASGDLADALAQFVLSAKAAQSQVQHVVNVMLVDGDDLGKQMDEARRDSQSQQHILQQQKWNADPRLVELRAELESAQQRYNAATGQGVTDPKVLDPLSQEIRQQSAQIAKRQQQLAIPPEQVSVDPGLAKTIESLRDKVNRGSSQVEQALAPVQKQLGSLGGLAPAAMSMDQVRSGMAALVDAVHKYAASTTQMRVQAPANVAQIQAGMDDLNTRINQRQSELDQQLQKAQAQQKQLEIAAVKKKLDTQKAAQDTRGDFEALGKQLAQARELSRDGRAALAELADLNDKLKASQAKADQAIKLRDEKQLTADHAFDLKPLTDSDIASAHSDTRLQYSLYAIAGFAVVFALLTLAASRQPPTAAAAIGDSPNSNDSPDSSKSDPKGEGSMDDDDDEETVIA